MTEVLKVYLVSRTVSESGYGQQGQRCERNQGNDRCVINWFYDIEQRFNQFSLNTVISGFMEYNNKLMDLSKKEGGIDKETSKTFVILLAPFAPHIGEEL